MSKISRVLFGAILIAMCAVASRAQASYDSLMGNDITAPAATGYVLFSDSSPIAYGAAAPNYVAPPAPPPIYIDQQTHAYCRAYSQQIRIGTQVQESYGTACLQPDGTWRIVQ